MARRRTGSTRRPAARKPGAAASPKTRRTGSRLHPVRRLRALTRKARPSARRRLRRAWRSWARRYVTCTADSSPVRHTPPGSVRPPRCTSCPRARSPASRAPRKRRRRAVPLPVGRRPPSAPRREVQRLRIEREEDRGEEYDREEGPGATAQRDLARGDAASSRGTPRSHRTAYRLLVLTGRP